MRVAIHQPQYLPWLGYFDKINQCDIFVILDNVQFKKNEWQNRNKIKTPQGWQWITVPVLHSNHLEKICDVRINHQEDWRRKHLRAIEINYNRAPFFKDYYPFFQELYEKEWTHLAALNRTVIEYLMESFGIKKQVLLSSEMALREGPTDRLIDICKAVGAETYLSGKGGESYLVLDRFKDANIRVVYQDFRCPIYPQLYGPFEPDLSAIDLLFHCGPESFSTLKQERKPK